MSCQFTVKSATYLNFNEGGDSGAPVTTDHTASGTGYWMAGIVSGGRTTDALDRFIYTPWANVDLEYANQHPYVDPRTNIRITR